MSRTDEREYRADAVDTLLDNWSVIAECEANLREVLGEALKRFDRQEYLIAGLVATYATQKFMQGGRSTASGQV